MPKFTLFDNPEKNLKAAGFKDEAHYSDVLKSDILSGIDEIVGVDFDPNPIREGDGGGSNRADLVCTVTESTENGEHKSTVIIENELGKSKHGHLGQCITYGSNRSAKIFESINCLNQELIHYKIKNITVKIYLQYF